ncbi:hypothetical protein, partial [Halococcus hamelinensis]|uniref:hypothetical protein n=1 Tax=Halococcus hamelinensis TaxID=332168 RepID=UPI001ED9477E
MDDLLTLVETQLEILHTKPSVSSFKQPSPERQNALAGSLPMPSYRSAIRINDSTMSSQTSSETQNGAVEESLAA